MPTRRRLFTAALGTLAAMGAARLSLSAGRASAQAIDPALIEALLAEADRNGTVRVIVELDVPSLEPGLPPAQARARLAAIAEAQSAFTKAIGAESVNRTFATVAMVALTLTGEQVQRLQAMEGIVTVHRDGPDQPMQ